MKTALLLSHSRDFFNIDRVTAELQAAKVKVVRLNTDFFPENIKISEQVNHSGYSVIVQTGGANFDSKEIDVVWYRKIWKPIINSQMEEKYLTASINESLSMRNSLFRSMQHLPWLDPLPIVKAASDKFYQLRSAQAVGLCIPKTIISNDAKAVRSFYSSLKSGMICKLHTSLSFSMKATAFSFYTTLIEKEDLDDLEMLSVCPMIFQERIPKAYELRIAYIDQQCFAGKIIGADALDWRPSQSENFSWESYQIPEKIQGQIIRLMQKLGLSFGAIDMIVQPDGTYVFLEVNPVGEWGMLEKELELPISKAIAKGLIKRLS